jgi:RimJ/RimL family protein N-acetyltransferase
MLRSLELKDAQRIAALANNWKIASMVSRVRHPYTEEDARSFLAQVNSPSARRHVFAVTRDNVFIGCIGIERLKPDSGDLGLGYWLGEPCWGRGLASEAGRAIVAFGFGALGLSRIMAGHFVDNPVSARVLEKLGFRYIGMVKRHCLARGHEVDMHMMVLERAQWERR